MSTPIGFTYNNPTNLFSSGITDNYIGAAGAPDGQSIQSFNSMSCGIAGFFCLYSDYIDGGHDTVTSFYNRWSGNSSVGLKNVLATMPEQDLDDSISCAISLFKAISIAEIGVEYSEEITTWQIMLGALIAQYYTSGWFTGINGYIAALVMIMIVSFYILFSSKK